MVVTEVKIKLVPRSDDKLLAFACVTLDRCFVLRDIKVIQGSQSTFIAMPSRKITDHCPKCSSKNHLQAAYCNQCGSRLPPGRLRPDTRGRTKLHADIAHPITVTCRNVIQEAILNAYAVELEHSRLPGYTPTGYEDDAGPEDDLTGITTPAHGTPAVRDSLLSAAALPSNAPKNDMPPPRQDANGFGVFGQ